MTGPRLRCQPCTSRAVATFGSLRNATADAIRSCRIAADPINRSINGSISYRIISSVLRNHRADPSVVSPGSSSFIDSAAIGRVRIAAGERKDQRSARERQMAAQSDVYSAHSPCANSTPAPMAAVPCDPLAIPTVGPHDRALGADAGVCRSISRYSSSAARCMRTRSTQRPRLAGSYVIRWRWAVADHTRAEGADMEHVAFRCVHRATARALTAARQSGHRTRISHRPQAIYAFSISAGYCRMTRH